MHTTEQLNTALDGRYVIERRIGAGGMAVVYLARDVKHQRLVALKVLNPELGAVLGSERFMSDGIHTGSATRESVPSRLISFWVSRG